MSKKDYQAVAAALYRIKTEETDHGTEARHILGAVRAALGDIFAAGNPRFDRARFIEACETGRTRGMRQVS